MKGIDNMSKNLGVVTRLGLTLLMSATLSLVQGCKDKPGTTTTDTTTKPATKGSLTFSSSPIPGVGAKDGAAITALGRNGNGDTFYIAGEGSKFITIWDGTANPGADKEIVASDTADNLTPVNFKWTYGGVGSDDPNFVAILPGPGSKAAAFADGLGSAIGFLNDEAGVLELDGADIKAGWRNNNVLMKDARNNRPFQAVAVNNKGWVAISDKVGGYAYGLWGEYLPAKVGENNSGIVAAAAADDDNNLYVTPAGVKGQGIYKTTVGGPINFAGAPFIAGSSLGIGSDKSNRVTKLAIVDGWLLVGERVSGIASEVANSGGVRAVNLKTNVVVPAKGLGSTVKKISANVANDEAFILTDKSPIYFKDGVFYDQFTDIPGAGFTNNPFPIFSNATDATFNKDGGIYVAVGTQVYEVEAN